MDETAGTPLSDDDVHQRLVRLGDELSADALRCETARGRTALASAGEMAYRIAELLRIGMAVAGAKGRKG